MKKKIVGLRPGCTARAEDGTVVKVMLTQFSRYIEDARNIAAERCGRLTAQRKQLTCTIDTHAQCLQSSVT